MNALSKFGTEIFIYNYLRNIYGLLYREDLADETIIWGFNSVESQTCIVNTLQSNDTDIQTNTILDIIRLRQTSHIQLISTVLYPQSNIWKNSGFELEHCEFIFQCSRSEKHTQTYPSFQSIQVHSPDEITHFFSSKDTSNYYHKNEVSDNIILLVNRSMISFNLIYDLESKQCMGAVVMFPLKGVMILELMLVSSKLADEITLFQMIETVLKIKECDGGTVLVISPQKLDSHFAAVGEIQRYKKENIKKTLLPVPICTPGAVLKTKSEYLRSIGIIDALGLAKHNDLPKNWDSLAALSQIVNLTAIAKSSAILDAGGEYYSVILHQLAAYGYTNLHCINLAFQSARTVGNISYQHGDITKTTFNDNYFLAVTCLSVVEHIPDIEAFFMELSRILRYGGILFISMDYWKDAIDTLGKQSYGNPIKIFDNHCIKHLINVAKKFSLELFEPVRLFCKNKVVSCDGFRYTFLYLSFRKVR